MKRSAEFNLRLYPWYVGIFHAYFWLPIYFLFFNSKLELKSVLTLASFYFFCVVAMEVPSGWFSDRFGRRRTLLAASTCLTFAYLIFIFAQDFYIFAYAQAFLAAGIAFNSGTDTSFLLESTQAAGKEDEYPAREAQATKYNFLGGGAAAMLGGLIGFIDYRGAYILSLLGAIAMIWITFTFMEPKVKKQHSENEGLNFRKQIAACFQLLKNIHLLWVFGFAVFLIVINHIPYEFYQPYLRELLNQWGAIIETLLLVVADYFTPLKMLIGNPEYDLVTLATGIHLTLTMLVASWFASCSIKIRDCVGLRLTLFFAGGLQIAIMTLMFLFVNIPVAIVMLLRSCPRALSTAPLNAAIAPKIPSAQRATFLSLISLIGRLGFGLTLFLFATKAGDESWQTISHMIKIGVWISVPILAFFIFTSLFISKMRTD